MGFNFEIIYRPGKDNYVADMLSRSGYIAVGPDIEDIQRARVNNQIWVSPDERDKLI